MIIDSEKQREIYISNAVDSQGGESIDFWEGRRQILATIYTEREFRPQGFLISRDVSRIARRVLIAISAVCV